MANLEWGFHYAGPYLATPNMKCATCMALNTKECPTHQKQTTKGCAHCASAEGAPCQAHWGLEAALNEYSQRLQGVAKSDFEAAKKIIMAEPPHPTMKQLTLTARSHGSLAEGQREFFVSMLARP